ncbi:MAG: HD domain-containing protein [Planctomycetes bacterium]|nr:HD domain-containing protein [Planctomycetota bacterium]
MSDTRGLLDRISAFRQRLDATPQLIPEAIPVDEEPDGDVVAEAEAFRHSVKQIVGAPQVDPAVTLPQFTDRAKGLLATAKQLLDRQRAFTADPLYAGLAGASKADAVVGYHRETVAVLDAVVRLARAFPDSAAEQLKLCDGLDGLLGVVRDRLAVQERALARRRTDAERTDRLAGFLAAVHTHQPADLQTVATLAEELLEDARQGRPIRFVRVPVASVSAYPGGAMVPAPARLVAAHAINVAQVVARVLPYDYEWSGRPLLPVVAALVMDCGMLAVPAHVLAKAKPLTADERRVIEAHPKYGAELLLYCFPSVSGPLAAAIATHHERGDGTGYPNGLRGADVPPLGRLLRAADVYAALSEERPHRPAMDPRAALTEVLLCAEQGQLDRDFAEYLLNLSFYPVGTVVELTDGRVGTVVANHPNRLDPRAPGRPVVAALTTADGSLLPRPEYVDLSAADRGGIVCGLSADRARELLGGRYPDLVS